MKKVLLIFCSFSFFVAHAQVPTYSAAFPAYTPTAGNVMGTIATNKFNQDKGSPYSTSDYTKGELWTSTNLHFTNEVDYLFDEMQNTLQIKTKKGEVVYVGSKIIDSFRLYIDDTTTIRYYKSAFLNGKMRDSSIYQAVYAGKRILVYKMPHKIFRYKEFQGGFSDGKQGYEYINRDDYYIKVGTKSLVPLKLTKKGLIQTIPNKRKELEAIFEYIDFYEEITESKLADILHKIEH